MKRIPHFLLTHGGEVLSVTRRQRFTSRKTPRKISYFSFLLEAK
jgi:hypothetical protein